MEYHFSEQALAFESEIKGFLDAEWTPRATRQNRRRRDRHDG